MKRLLVASCWLLGAVLAMPSQAFATWSIVAVDRSTGRVVIASATCVDQNDEFLKGVQAVIVPGKGVAACQAAVDNTHANQMVVFQELQKGTDPKAIIEILSKDPAFQSRQFGIVDLQGRRAGHSGLTNGYVSQDIQGRCRAPTCSIQFRATFFDPVRSYRMPCRRSSRPAARSPIA
jgi:Uncharacterized conserved protein